MRRARILLGFSALGVFWGAWGAALPAIQRRAAVDDGQLGLALVVVGFGALVSMRGTGVLIDRLGPRVTALSVAAFGVAGFLSGLAGSPAQLYVAALLLGGASGAGILQAAGAGPPVALGVAAVAVLVTAAAVREPSRLQGELETGVSPPRLLQRVPVWVLVLGGLGALAFWIESAWQNWSSVHLERTLDASPAVSSLGPAAFAASMTVGRLVAQRLLERSSERRLLVLGALLAGVGSAVAVAAPAVGLALAGILAAGAGCSVFAPIIIGLVGKAAPVRERATLIGSVTTLMYLGFLVGPAAVGGVAQLTSLQASLAAVAGLAFLLALLFSVVRLPR